MRCLLSFFVSLAIVVSLEVAAPRRVVGAAEGNKQTTQSKSSTKSSKSAVGSACGELSGSFHVLSAIKSYKETMMTGGMLLNAGSGNKSRKQSDGQVTSPKPGEVFIVLSWDLGDFIAPNRFSLPKDSLNLVLPNGKKIKPIAKSKWNGKYWAPGGEVIWNKGSRIGLTWLFTIAEKDVSLVEVQFCDRKEKLEIQ